MLYRGFADSGLGAGQPLPECSDVVGSRAAAPSNYPCSLLTPPLGVFQVLRRAGGLQCMATRRIRFGQVEVIAQTRRCDAWLRLIDVLNSILRRNRW